MTKTTLLSATAATFAMALLALPLLAGSANASVTSKLLNCQYNSRAKVVDCCQRIVNKYERPMWMTNDNGSCSAAVKCVGSKTPSRTAIAYVPAKPKCFIYIPQRPEINRTPNDNPKGGRDTPTRGNNGNTKPF